MKIKINKLIKSLKGVRLFLMLQLFLFLLMNICVWAVSVRAGLILLIFGLILLAPLLWIYIYRRGELRRVLITDNLEQSQVQYQLMQELPFPYALVDEKGKIFWVNYAFSRICPMELARFRNIHSLFPELKKADMNDMTEKAYHIIYGEQYYKLSFYKIVTPEGMEESEDSNLFAMCMTDETDIIRMDQEIKEQRMVVGMAYLDNYEEIVGQVEEVRIALIIAHIDRKVTKYFSQMGGIVKKIERDKYFLVLPQKNVENMKADRFYILDEIRDIKIGNDQHITMSIGLGMGEGSYETRYEYSRTAVEMALGRGGDQVAIKSGDDIEYIGGSAQTVSRTTRVKARVKAHALKELLMNNDNVLIMAHKMPDLDAIGASVGVYRIASSQGKRVHIVLNEISSSVRPVVERLNAAAGAGVNMFINGEAAEEMMSDNTLLIIVDTNRGSYTECPELLEMSSSVVVIDHHRRSNDSITHAVLDYVEPYASSACEMVVEILQYIGDNIKMKVDEADAMYAGIVMDTNNFMNKTGVRTFEAAAFLRRGGADTVRVRKLFRDNMEEYKARAEAVRCAEIYLGKFALSTCPSEGLESPTIAGAQAANELLDIKGVEASIVLTAYNNKIYLSARSIDSVNVQIIMERLGGGGHGTMAGAQMTGCTIEEAMEYVKVTLHDMTEEGAI
ncbi:MAG: DHH family phosphoesterase [Lachnospiraceae bacterium]|nr:DHH family phosphoesterase [Lachnospiraceae bacterium]MDY4971696.1 DHH family phosphoesterase [Lachnospiraceae bacterium]